MRKPCKRRIESDGLSLKTEFVLEFRHHTKNIPEDLGESTVPPHAELPFLVLEGKQCTRQDSGV